MMDPTAHRRTRAPSPERWERIEALFDAALDLPPGERGALLGRACARDPSLREEIEGLLRACEGAGDFLETAATDLAAPFLPGVSPLISPLAAGNRVGPYRVVRQLARGGMGVVYLAERDDGEYHKRVALKVVAGSWSPDDELIARFRDERQILASLEHPGIARLIDGGVTDTGLPYFIMEYVEGVAIDRYCDDHGLTIEERLTLFCIACDAVEHAHVNRIVHRDLKPSNVLVAGFDQSGPHSPAAQQATQPAAKVKLLDFGIASVLDSERVGSAEQTRSRLRRLTPEYASPEQIRGDEVSPASDVYSLGVLLYRLLTGRSPYEPPAPEAGEERPVPGTGLDRPSPVRGPTPYRLRGPLRGDLDAIVLKALEEEPERRYATAGDLAADVRRHLEGGLVVAREGGRLALMRWFARRHPVPRIAGVAVVGAVVVLALAGLSRLVLSRSAAPALDPQRVLVAPFGNRTGQAALDPVGSMAADWIIEGLAHTGMLKVVPFTSALSSARHLGDTIDPTDTVERQQALARQTAAGIVVSGSYYLQGDSIYLQSRITGAISGTVLEALEPVSAPASQPLNAVQELRQRVVASLAPHVDPRLRDHARVVSRTPSYDAYREYAEGMERYVANQDWRGALVHFARATQHDPEFTLPMVRAAVIHLQTNNPVAADSVSRLLEPRLDQLAEFDRLTITSAAAWANGDHARTYRAAARAAQLAPNTMPHYLLANTLLALNRPGEALRVLKELDPHRGELRGWSSYWIRLAETHHRLGDHREELQVARRARHFLPESDALRLEVRALIALGKVAEALRALEDHLATPDDGRRGSMLQHTALELYAHGHADAAHRLFERSLAWYAARPGVPTRALGEAYYRAGRWNDAEQVLRDVAARMPEDLYVRGLQGAVAARRGDRPEVERISAWLADLEQPYLLGQNTYWRSRIAALLGEHDEAVDLLRTAYIEGKWSWLDVHYEPDLEALRRHPRFRELLRPKG